MGSLLRWGRGREGGASAPALLGQAACLGDEWCGDVMHDVRLHSVGMWPAAQGEATSPAAFVPTSQAPIVAADVGVKKKGLQGEREQLSPLRDEEKLSTSGQVLP